MSTHTPGATEPDWSHLKPYGYAPGNYLFRCGTCNKAVVAGKRAVTCRQCAEQMHATPAAEIVPLTDEQIDALMPIGEAQVLWFDPALRIGPEPAGKIIDASMAFMAGARLGTKLFSREQVREVVRKAIAKITGEPQ